jgi:hypothetical protein
VNPDFLAGSPSSFNGLSSAQFIHALQYPPFLLTSLSLVKQDKMSEREEETVKKKRRKRDGHTGDTTRFPTPSLIFSLIKSLTSLPSGKVCRKRINGSKNCIRCESGGVASDSEGGGWA